MNVQKVVHVKGMDWSNRGMGLLGRGVVITVALLIVAAAPLRAQQKAPPPPVVTVKATGLGNYKPQDVAGSRAEALEAAQRDAVEQASGVILTAETQVRNFQLVQDEVLTRSRGFVRRYKVLEEKREGNLYKMVIEAEVSRDDFLKDMDDALENLYRRVGMPRVLAVIHETMNLSDTNGQQPEDLRITEKEIRKILIKRGFTFIDPRSLFDTSLVEMAVKGGGVPKDAALKAARTAKAEVVILGRASTSGKKVSGFNVFQSDVSLDVVRVDDGQVMASETGSGRGLNVNEQKAAVQSLQKAAEEITPKMMEQVSYIWVKEKNEGARIEIEVRNAGFGQLITLRRDLTNKVSGVTQVKQRSFSQGTALLEVRSRKSPDQVAEALYNADFGNFKLEIVNVGRSTLTVSVKPK